MDRHIYIHGTHDAIALVPVHGSKEVAAPVYAHFPLSAASEDRLAGWAASWGLALPYRPHITVAYSRKPIVLGKVAAMSAGLIVPPGGRSIENFGDALVLCVDCPQLHERHADYMKAGASWDYPSYRPHVSLAYGDASIYAYADSVPPYDEPITLMAEERQALDTDYGT